MLFGQRRRNCVRFCYKKMKYPIRKYGDPVLREKARPVDEVTEEVRAFAANLIETMRGERGLGLAAQQVGETRAVCVVEVPRELDMDERGERLHPDMPTPLVLINPEIVEFSDDTVSAQEGCLSFPEIYAPITRSESIRIRYKDLDGKDHDERFRAMAARVIQHEVDHLNGILYIDRMSQIKKIAIKGRLRRMKEETEERLGLLT